MRTNASKKDLAIKLRKRGKGIRDIEKTLGVRRSTLSSWLRNVELTEAKKHLLHKKWLRALVKARAKAAQWHRDKKTERINNIRKNVDTFISNVTIDKILGELLFAIFYLAEGTKRENSVVFANSNPKILEVFLKLFRYLYIADESKFRCCLHLRADQNEDRAKNYWSKILNISKNKFLKTQFDKRASKPTHKNYMGVCVVIYFSMDIQRRIIYLGEKILQNLEINLDA